MLMNECKNPDPVAYAQCIYSRKNLGQNEPYSYEIYPISKPQTVQPWQISKSHMDIQSYNMFTVLKYAINEILCVSV